MHHLHTMTDFHTALKSLLPTQDSVFPPTRSLPRAVLPCLLPTQGSAPHTQSSAPPHSSPIFFSFLPSQSSLHNYSRTDLDLS